MGAGQTGTGCHVGPGEPGARFWKFHCVQPRRLWLGRSSPGPRLRHSVHPARIASWRGAGRGGGPPHQVRSCKGNSGGRRRPEARGIRWARCRNAEPHPVWHCWWADRCDDLSQKPIDRTKATVQHLGNSGARFTSASPQWLADLHFDPAEFGVLIGWLFSKGRHVLLRTGGPQVTRPLPLRLPVRPHSCDCWARLIPDARDQAHVTPSEVAVHRRIVAKSPCPQRGQGLVCARPDDRPPSCQAYRVSNTGSSPPSSSNRALSGMAVDWSHFIVSQNSFT